MNQVENYTRELARIFLLISDMIKAADSDKMLRESERHDIKLFLQASRTMLAESVFNPIKLCLKHDEECDTRQL